MTAEQKLEKCKELVSQWRAEAAEYAPIDDCPWLWCIEELQAVLEETDE